ncbi:MAG: alanyl-tRNA editing protein [Chloroflexota bacterium]
MTEQLYFDDPLTLDFTAEVTQVLTLPDGRFGAVLPRTYFYPTSGGQEHDTGSLGPARVLDVVKQDGEILHVLDRKVDPGLHPARIDGERRFRHMQHHTGQHILSAAFIEVLGIDSISANINGDSPSTIDLDTDPASTTGAVSGSDLNRVETFTNGVLFENRPVKSYYVTDADVPNIPFRKPPKVTGRIRVVEVDGLDITPCGGTHCLSTGMVGVLKIVRTERANQKLRVHFVAGAQALEFFQQAQAAAQGAALALDTGLDGVVGSIERLQAQLKQASFELDNLREIALELEAGKLAEAAGPVGTRRLVTALFEGRDPADLRILAQKLRGRAGTVSLLVAFDGRKLSLVASCADDTGLDARDLLQKHLAPFGGRGGGDARLAQGGGPVDGDALEGLFANTKGYLEG